MFSGWKEALCLSFLMRIWSPIPRKEEQISSCVQAALLSVSNRHCLGPNERGAPVSAFVAEPKSQSCFVFFDLNGKKRIQAAVQTPGPISRPFRPASA